MRTAVWKLDTSNRGTQFTGTGVDIPVLFHVTCGLKELSLYLGNFGKSASTTQYAQVLCATDGKVGIPGAARQEMVRVQQSRAARRMVTHSILFSSLLLFYISFCISW